MASRSGWGARALVLGGVALVVLTAAVAVLARIAAAPRSALLFTDGDSMLPLLVMRAIDAGQPQDWAMSSVLFLPELAVFRILWLLRLGPDATVVLAGILNLIALFGAVRVAAGSRRKARMPLAATLLAYLVFAVLAALDQTASRESLELASLTATTTYYSATVVAVVVSIGLLRRAGEPVRASPVPALVGLAAVAAASVLSNPIFLFWATGPLVVVAAIVGLQRRGAPEHPGSSGRAEAPPTRPSGSDPADRSDDRGAVVWWAAVALVAGSAIGYLARVPLARFIANDGLGYIDVTAVGSSAEYYLAHLLDLWRSPAGIASSVLTAALIALAVACGIRLRGSAASVVAIAGWVLPLVVVVGAVVLGTHAARYLQPVVLAPVAALVVVPQAFPAQADAVGRWLRARAVPAAGVGATLVAIVVGLAFGVPRLLAPRADADLDCVVAWVDASGRTGAGQFWTVRLPKTRLADPAALVQVDAALNPYEWLVDRSDSRAGTVSFLVVDAQSTPFALPGVRIEEADLVTCGRYTIADFGDRELPLGTPHS